MLKVLLPRAQRQVVLGGDSYNSLDRILDESDPNREVPKNVPKTAAR